MATQQQGQPQDPRYTAVMREQALRDQQLQASAEVHSAIPAAHEPVAPVAEATRTEGSTSHPVADAPQPNSAAQSVVALERGTAPTTDPSAIQTAEAQLTATPDPIPQTITGDMLEASSERAARQPVGVMANELEGVFTQALDNPKQSDEVVN